MITDLEREVSTLRDDDKAQGSQGAVPVATADSEFQDRLADVMVAEDALMRAWATDDDGQRHVIADTAMLSVLQAEPNHDFATRASRDRLLGFSSEEMALERRILGILALAEITSKHEVIETEQLRVIASQISVLHDVAPAERVTQLVHGLGKLAVKVHELPPMWLATSSNLTPHDALQELDNQTWVREAVGEGFESVWLQEWARPLSGRDMLLGLVVDDAGSNEELEVALRGGASSDLPALVLSDRLDKDVVARVAAAGAVFVPRSSGIAGLGWAIMGLAERMRGLSRISDAPAGFSAKPARVSEAQIAVHWREEGYYSPPREFVDQANASDPAIIDRFIEDKFPGCFREYADLLTWDEPWQTVLDTSSAPFWKWFEGGKLNASFNCVDRHAATNPDKTAIIWVPEPESDEAVHISYAELQCQVTDFALLLRDFAGVKTGDRVTIHLPMVPELPIAMLACARLGAIHSAVFGGFSGRACATRIADSGSHVLITMDGYYRAGDLIDHKVKADEAVDLAAKEGSEVGTAEVDKVLVWRRHSGRYASKMPMVEGRDFFIDELLTKYRGKSIAPVPMAADAPLFLMYTSGTTGRPKGCQHSTGGYLAYVAGTSKYYHDIHPNDVHWSMADIGWMTGHSYGVYGPLALGATIVIYEGLPEYPDSGRPWRVAEKLGVTTFHTTPTAIRMLRKFGPDEPKKYKYHFKHMATMGEPIEPEVWRWYHSEVGKAEAAIVDTWWHTEAGGILCSTLPALQPMKPGSCGPGALGIYPVIYDEDGNEVPKGSGRGGDICIRNPWPGIMQTIWGDTERYVDTYYRKYCKNSDSKDWHDWPYFAGDGAVLAADGYFRILGRVDDVINVAGQRLGTKEIESAALTVGEISEAAAVPVMDPVHGRAVEIYVSLKAGFSPGQDIEEKVSRAIESEIGKIALPRNVWVVPDMPKTRSGMIIRRIIAGISNFADIGDTTTLANSETVEGIRRHVQREKVAHGEVPRPLSPEEEAEIEAPARIL